MRLLQVILTMDPRYGGPVEGIIATSKVLAEHGHTLHVLCLDSPEEPWLNSPPIQVFAIGPSKTWHKAAKRVFPWMRYSYTPNLAAWLEENAKNYHAVVVNGLWNYASFGTWWALRKSRLGVPYYVYPHGMLDPWIRKAQPIKSLIKGLFWRAIEHRVLRDAAGVLFTCEVERQLASQSFKPYSAKEYVIGFGARDIPGGARRQQSAFFSNFPQLQQRRKILFLSRIHEKKGVDLLLSAFARCAREYPEFDLVIAGAGEQSLQKRLHRLASDLDIDRRVHWTGMLSGDVKWGAFRSADFFVLPSHQENFGVAIVEAMAASRPVLITNKVNIFREIELSGAGLVVNDQLACVERGLRKLCSMTPAQLESMGHLARECFLARFDMERNALGVSSVVRDTIAADRRSEAIASDAKH